jgi:hypothetical protein
VCRDVFLTLNFGVFMLHNGVEYKPDWKGLYRCPNDCWNPDYPQPGWKTEKGFEKHLNECMGPRKWNPPPKPPKEVFGTCLDCGGVIWKMESCWTMPDKTVCVTNGCWEEYFEKGIGYHDAAGLVLPGMTLEG